MHGDHSAASNCGPPIVVVGMHRSGTSATTRVLNLLGLPTASNDDLMPPNEGNPEGYWESTALSDFDERLLDALGASWWSPLRTEQVDLSRVTDYQDEARTLLERFLPAPPFVWKDPRLSLLLGFWRELLTEAVYVLVHRDAISSAESLARRDGLSVVHGIALWQRYVKSCLTDLAGAKVVVVAFEDLTNEPRSSVANLVTSLRQLGVPIADNGEAWRSVGPARTRPAAYDAPLEVNRFRRRLLELGGVHERFPVSLDLEESAWVEPLLEAHRRVWRQ